MTRWRAAAIVGGCATVAAIAFGFALPRRAAVGAVRRSSTRVVAVHAGGGSVPSNLLRVYVELSAPMEPGSAYERIRLVDEARREVPDAFLRLDEELWSPDRRRLTLLFDPGRVKRGIRANDEMGAPLRAGHRYRIVIDSAWRDADNRPLSSPFEQELRVGSFDSTSPDPSRWTISSPRRGTRDTVEVTFDKSLDHGLATDMISVVDSTGARVAGRVALSDDDRRWTFVPSRAWPPRAASLRLRVEPTLEDLAGNSVARPFDSDRQRGGSSAEAGARVGPSLVTIR